MPSEYYQYDSLKTYQQCCIFDCYLNFIYNRTWFYSTMSFSSHTSCILFGMGHRSLVDYLNNTKLSSGFKILITHTIRVINHQVQVTHHTKTCTTMPL